MVQVVLLLGPFLLRFETTPDMSSPQRACFVIAQRTTTDLQKKGALMTIKIQPPITETEAGHAVRLDGFPLLAYNRDRKFHVSIDSTQVKLAGHYQRRKPQDPYLCFCVVVSAALLPLRIVPIEMLDMAPTLSLIPVSR